jgi:hypothetical protein
MRVASRQLGEEKNAAPQGAKAEGFKSSCSVSDSQLQGPRRSQNWSSATY